jgi:hypothetical protein
MPVAMYSKSSSKIPNVRVKFGIPDRFLNVKGIVILLLQWYYYIKE